MDLCNVPKLDPIPVVFMDRADIVKMREWATEHGQCVRQLTVRQQTTKFSAGALPLTTYSVELRQDPLTRMWRRKLRKNMIPIPTYHYLVTRPKKMRMIDMLHGSCKLEGIIVQRIS